MRLIESHHPCRGGLALRVHAHLASVHLGGHARGLRGDAGGDADLSTVARRCGRVEVVVVQDKGKKRVEG